MRYWRSKKFVSARMLLQRTRSDGQAFKPAREARALPGHRNASTERGGYHYVFA
jgi:hypothetical protein